MPYDKDGKYFRKQAFNEKFKYTILTKKNNNKNSKIIDSITSSPSDRDIRVHDILFCWHRLTIHKCINADIQEY